MRNGQKKIFNHRVWLIGGLISVMAQSAIASPEQERVYLLQLLHQMHAMQSTLLLAEKEQSKTARVQFHYTAYRDAQGHWHNGVREDLKGIESGIQAHCDQAPVEPRAVEPMDGDYRADEPLTTQAENRP